MDRKRYVQTHKESAERRGTLRFERDRVGKSYKPNKFTNSSVQYKVHHTIPAASVATKDYA